MLIRAVVEHQIDNHPQPLVVSQRDKALEIIQVPIIGMNAIKIGNIIAIIPQRRWIHGQQPDAGDPQLFQMIEPGGYSAKISNSVTIAIGKGPQIEFVKDSVFIPERFRLLGQLVPYSCGSLRI